MKCSLMNKQQGHEESRDEEVDNLKSKRLTFETLFWPFSRFNILF